MLLLRLVPFAAAALPALAFAWCVGGAPPARDGDDDGLNDIQEEFFGTDPAAADSDRDGVSDGDEDRDGDGIANKDEPTVFSVESFLDPFAPPGKPYAVVLEGTNLRNLFGGAVTVRFPDMRAALRSRDGGKLSRRVRIYFRLSGRQLRRLAGRLRVETREGDTNVLTLMPMLCPSGPPKLMGAAVVQFRTRVNGVRRELSYVVAGGCNVMERRGGSLVTKVRLRDRGFRFALPFGAIAALPSRVLLPKTPLAKPDPLQPMTHAIGVGEMLRVMTRAGSSAFVTVEPAIAQLRIPKRSLEEDHDQDGLTTLQELELHTDPLVTDTDGDGMTDGAEVGDGTDPRDIDSDGDGRRDGRA